jgi:hypothetical protein
VGGSTTNALPDLECLQSFSLVHKVPRRFRHEENTDTHNSGEYKRGTKDVAPITRYSDEHGSNSVAKNFSESNVELVEGNEVTTESAFDSFGDVDGDGTTFETDTSTEDDTGSNDHAVVHRSGFERTTDGVEDTGDENSPTATKVFVAWRDEEGTGNSS